MENIYTAQVGLLLEILPLINEYDCFALKGGTAINLFVRNMPRLSVDIDLTYLPIEDRKLTLKNIELVLKDISKKIKGLNNNSYKVEEIPNKNEGTVDTLYIIKNNSRIIIEVNPVFRGAVFNCEQRHLCPVAQDKFLTFCKIKALSLADLYGSKICAALGRHKPRDLFDVMLLLNNEGITEQIRQAFIIYLASTNRPMHELLTITPNLKNLEIEYINSFEGMTSELITCKDLEITMHRLIKIILDELTVNERKFLLSIKLGNPKWDLLPVIGIDSLPSVHWKISNIKKLQSENLSKYKEQLYNLQKILAV